MRSRLHTALAVASLCLLAGCAGDRPRAPRVLDVPWPIAEVTAASGSGARWTYAPARPAGLLGRARVDEHQTLYFGRRGERWLRDETTGAVTAAGDLAEQDLVAAARSTNAWAFVGRAGAIFEAASPLDPFSRASAPPEPMASVAGEGSTLAGVTLRGTLLVSHDGGRSYARAKIDAPFVGDVEMLDESRGLALAFPERLFSTSDGGLSFTPVDVEAVGATDLVREPAAIVAEGLTRAVVWPRDGSPRVRKKGAQPLTFDLGDSFPETIDPADLREGRGFLVGDRTFMVGPNLEKEKGPGPWQLGHAALGERLSFLPLPGTEGCHRVVIDGDEGVLFAACSMQVRGASHATTRILRYRDVREAPDVLSATLEGALGEARIAAIDGGGLVAWGVCRAGGASGCDTDAPLVLSRWENATAADAPKPSPAPSSSASPSREPSPWSTVTAPTLNARPLAVRRAKSGPGVFLVARRGKSAELALFVSHDHGKSFEPRDLHLTSGDAERRSSTQQQGVSSATISTAEDGIVSVAFEGTFGALMVVADDEGRPLTASSPPVASSSTRLGIAGRRALAVDAAAVFETLDGGVSWRSMGELGALRCEPRSPSCEHTIVCASAGCVVGTEVTRLGWGGAEPPRARTDLEAHAPPSPVRPTPAPLSCRLGKEKWAALPRGLARAPTAMESDLGKMAWAALVEDPIHGNASMIQSPYATPGRVEEAQLFPPVRDPDHWAVRSTLQVEGAAALRFSIGDDRRPKTFEVAWANLFEGKLSRGTIATSDPPRAGVDYVARGLGMAALAQTRQLSITSGGILVMGATASAGSPLYFLDHRGHVDSIPYPRWPTQSLDGQPITIRDESVRVDGTTVPIGWALEQGAENLAPTSSRIVRARGAEIDALSLFASPGSSFEPRLETSITYVGGAPAILESALLPGAGTRATGVFPLRKDGVIAGPRIAVPTYADALAKPRACTAQDRAKTPRTVAQVEAGMRRAVLVDGPDGSRFAVLGSMSMVLYGTLESPCIAAFDAQPLPSEDSQLGDSSDRALILFGDLEHAWFFRPGVGEGQSFEARAMRCRIEPTAVLTPEVARALEFDPASTPPPASRRPPRIRR